MKKSNNGSGIIWVITVIMVLSIIVVGALSFAYYTSASTINKASTMQAEMDARTAVQAVVLSLEASIGAENGVPNTVTSKTDLEINLPNEKTEVLDAYIQRTSSEELIVFVEVRYKNMRSNCKAYMFYESSQWRILNYEVGDAT